MTPWWHDHPWRLIQTNLREIDMRDISAARVAADLRAFQATVLMINAAGIIASYPTRLPYHFPSPYLGGDSLRDILAACHAAGIRVIARTDFSKVRRPIFEQHPDWAYRTAGGEAVDYNGDVHVCLNSPYQQECKLAIIEELLSTHDFDGIFFNMAGYITRDYAGRQHGPCHCGNCARLFRAASGLELPRGEDADDAVHRAYEAFKAQTVRAHHEKVYRFITERWPQVCIANHLEFGRGFIRQECNTAVDRPLPVWQYDGSANTKWAVASYPRMVCSSTTVDFIDFPYRHVAVSPHQQALRLAQGLANGGGLDYYLIGRLDNHQDRSGFEPVRRLFAYHAANQDHYRGLRSGADVALLRDSQDGEFRGWFRFLAEGHFLFDTLLTRRAAELPWEQYRAVIVPGIEALGDELAAKLDAFVEAGGTLVATGPAGFRDGAGAPRERPALRCLGLTRLRRVRTDTRSTYLLLDDRTGLRHSAETDLVYVDGPWIDAEYAPTVQRRFRVIPPHWYGPPERCYYTEVSDEPGLLLHAFGRGRALYLPWLPGALFHRQGHLNTPHFIWDVLQGVAGLEPVGGEVSPMVEVTLLHQPDGGRLVHLVNASGHFGNSFHAPVRMANVRLCLAQDRPAQQVISLVHRRAVEHTWRGGRLEIVVPELQLFEALRVA